MSRQTASSAAQLAVAAAERTSQLYALFWVVQRPYQIVYLLLTNPVRPCTCILFGQLAYCVTC